MNFQGLFDSFNDYFQKDYEDDFPLDEFDYGVLDNYLNFSSTHQDVRSTKMPFSEFVKYIYNKIDPEKSILITKDMLLMIEKAFILEFGEKWTKLTRKDKRKKERVLRGLHENFDLLYSNIESDPDKYLRFTKELIIKKYVKDQKVE